MLASSSSRALVCLFGRLVDAPKFSAYPNFPQAYVFEFVRFRFGSKENTPFAIKGVLSFCNVDAPLIHLLETQL
jgi:hypothetical protein